MIKITNLIIHEIIKKAKETSTEMILSKDTLPDTDLNRHLVEKIHNTFSGSTIKNTRFADRNDKAFKKQFEKYYENKIEFIHFTKESLTELKINMSNEPLATGGYYLFSDYTYENQRFLGVVILRKKESFNFLLKNEVFEISAQDILNIDKLAMGVRLNFSIYSSKNDERNFLALVTNQNDKLSDYFIDWVVADSFLKNEQNTSALVRILKDIDVPLDENGQPLSREKFHSKVYSYIESNPNRMVDLRDIAAFFYGPDHSNKLIKHADDKNIEIDTEFKRTSKELKRLIKIKASVEGIELITDFDKINDNDVQVLEDKIIIHSKPLADKVRAQHNE